MNFDCVCDETIYVKDYKLCPKVKCPKCGKEYIIDSQWDDNNNIYYFLDHESN